MQNRSYVQYDELFPPDSAQLLRLDGYDVPPTSRPWSRPRTFVTGDTSGIDLMSLVRVGVKTVLMQNTSQGGGSTITQQLAKNLFPRDINENRGKIARTTKLVVSKLKEWITALKLEYNYTKEEIAAMYLNTVEFGSNAYGIKSAAHTFFNKEPHELNIQEAALLAGLVKGPTMYSPRRNPENALARRNLVLDRMASAGAITRHQRDSIAALPILLNYKPVSHNEGPATYFREMLRLTMNAERPKRRQFQNDWDYEQAVKEYDENPIYGWCLKNTKADGTPYDIYRDGLKIYTTIDSRMQEYAEQAIQKQMESVIQPQMDAQFKRTKTLFIDADRQERERIMRNAIRYSDRYYQMQKAGVDEKTILASFDKPCPMKIFTYKGERDTVLTPRDSILHHKRIMRASFVAMDPRSGYVKAYVGGPNFRYFKYDMAKQGKRRSDRRSNLRLYLRHRPPGTESLHARTEPAGDDRNRQRGTLVAQGGRQGRTERRAAPPELGPGPQPQQLFGVDHETGQAAAGRGQLHSQHGHPQLHRSCACALPGNLGIQRL
mgnify:CR=1 FL=1